MIHKLYWFKLNELPYLNSEFQKYDCCIHWITKPGKQRTPYAYGYYHTILIFQCFISRQLKVNVKCCGILLKSAGKGTTQGIFTVGQIILFGFRTHFKWVFENPYVYLLLHKSPSLVVHLLQIRPFVVS